MALALIGAWKVSRRAEVVAAGIPPPVLPQLRMGASSLFHVAILMACPLGSWQSMYAKYDILASAAIGVLYTESGADLPGQLHDHLYQKSR